MLAQIPDAIDIAARGERLTIIGLCIALIVVLIAGILLLWRSQQRQNVIDTGRWEARDTAALALVVTERAQRDLERHTRDQERQSQFEMQLSVMRDNSVALHSSAAASQSLTVAVQSMKEVIQHLTGRQDRA